MIGVVDFLNTTLYFVSDLYLESSGGGGGEVGRDAEDAQARLH